MAIEQLPYEIFEMIARLVAQVHLPSVRALAHSSRACRIMSLPTLHHTFQIRFKAIDRLGPQIRTGHGILRKQNSFQYVHRLIVDDGLTNQVNSKLIDQALAQFPKIRYDAAAQEDHKARLAWQCLATLLRYLLSLRDLIFACCRPFPECVLQALHTYRPSCRLHIRFLQWGRLANCRTSIEHQLVRSPCLFSVTADETKKEILRMIFRFAPNLREAKLLRFRLFPSLQIDRPPRPVALPGWGYESGLPTASLRSLQIDCSRLDMNLINIWQKATDFSLLEQLSLTGYLWVSELNHLTDNVRLPCLKYLTLDHLILHYTQPQHMPALGRDHDRALEGFLTSLPELTRLKLGSFHWSWVKVNLGIGFLQHHGSRLEALDLEWFPKKKLRVTDLELIAKDCPLLRHFGLTLPRSYESPDEMALYKALGSMRNLQSVSLALDVSLRLDGHGGILDGEADDGEIARTMRYPKVKALNSMRKDTGISYPLGLGRGHLWLKLVICACDQALARAIFEVISSGKPQGSLPLDNLRVWPTHPDDFGRGPCPFDLACVLYTISQQWNVTRIVRNHGPDDLQVRQSIVRNTCTENACYKKPLNLPWYLQRVWRVAWPQKKSDNWWEDWSSYPLAPPSDDEEDAH